MNTLPRGSVQLWVLGIAGICALLWGLIAYKYRADLQRYAKGPLAMAHSSVVKKPVVGRRFLMRYPSRSVPTYTIIGELKNRPVLHHEVPAYPEWAEEKGVSSSVRLSFRVNSEGNVAPNVWVTQAGHPDLDAAAVEALKRWKFAPVRAPRKYAEHVDINQEANQGQRGVINFQFLLASNIRT